MICWIKLKHSKGNKRNDYICIEDQWLNFFYIASDKKSDLKKIVQNDNIKSNIDSYKFVKKFERITDRKKSTILKLLLKGENLKLANYIEKIKGYHNFRLYNVDISLEQKYFFEHNIFPLGFFNIKNLNSTLEWSSSKEDNDWSTNYNIPSFRSIYIKINLQKGKITKPTDRLRSIIVTLYKEKVDDNDNTCNNNTFKIESSSEEDILKKLTDVIRSLDPDFILTDDGDSFTLPYLIHRAKINGVDLYWGRDNNIPLTKSARNDGISYFSYGRMYFKPSTIRLYGRIHIDLSNSFIFRTGSSFDGLCEISRLCRMPLHAVSRSSIGKCLTSLHLYNAIKRELLIPWKPVLNEHPKALMELHIADRGGLILEPELGVHERIAEFDFISLYPSIMLKRNISAETILCDCCFDNPKFIVPELNYHICNKIGLVPESLRIVLEKRSEYKELKKKTSNLTLKKIYDNRQAVLKWILVTSFGYLGFSNAKFGRIDAHIAVCAFARNILLKTMHIVENMGFDIVHGIVDSIWIRKNNTTKKEYLRLKEIIEKNTNFDLSFEGIYKWIAFLPSEIKYPFPVPNRYFGVFEDGTIKTRGIETRRHDTPLFLKQCQNEILEIMSKKDSIQDIKKYQLSLVIKKVKIFLSLLKTRKVAVEDLIFTKQLSKDYNQYNNRNTLENSAIKKLEINGENLKAGQLLQYVITDYNGHLLKRTTPIQLINYNTNYDVKKYSELLIDTCNTILKPFGIMLTQDEAIYMLKNY